MSLKLLLRRGLLVALAATTGGAAALSASYSDLKFGAASAGGRLLQLLDAEQAHGWAIWAARRGALPREGREDPPSLRVVAWGRAFSNPIGLAAGFDKNAEVVEQMLGLGLGFVEIGSVTPLPQEGNPKPRIFRVREHRAVINRCGFNNDGVDTVAGRLEHYRNSQSSEGSPTGALGVNLGINKQNTEQEAAGDDLCVGAKLLAPYADYVVINISSPNTPGLRALQSRHHMQQLLQRVKSTLKRINWGDKIPPPLLVKISPDITDQDKKDIAALALQLGFDGLIVSNTTTSRPGPLKEWTKETGGLSGAPLFDLSTEVLREMYSLTRGTVPIVGCGGVTTGEDAYKKIRAGASLVQLYTALAYDGPALVPRIKRELAECLERDGFSSVEEAIGADHREGV